MRSAAYVITPIIGLCLFGCTRKSSEPEAAAPTRQEPAQTAPSEKFVPEPVHAGKTVPEAPIAIDGEADDWADVPVFAVITHDDWVFVNYGVEDIKMARDDEYLYVCMRLCQGIRERFDNQVSGSGRPSSGAIGYLRISADSAKYSVWLPTGFRIQSSPEGTSSKPTADFELCRIRSDGDSESLLKKESIGNPDFIAFSGKHLELKLPLELVPVTESSSIEIELDEF